MSNSTAKRTDTVGASWTLGAGFSRIINKTSDDVPSENYFISTQHRSKFGLQVIPWMIVAYDEEIAATSGHAAPQSSCCCPSHLKTYKNYKKGWPTRFSPLEEYAHHSEVADRLVYMVVLESHSHSNCHGLQPDLPPPCLDGLKLKCAGWIGINGAASANLSDCIGPIGDCRCCRHQLNIFLNASSHCSVGVSVRASGGMCKRWTF